MNAAAIDTFSGFHGQSAECFVLGKDSGQILETALVNRIFKHPVIFIIGYHIESF